jgi:hypothetical protein
VCDRTCLATFGITFIHVYTKTAGLCGKKVRVVLHDSEKTVVLLNNIPMNSFM